ncbi:c-type cytochrome [Spirosoma sp. HMF3257]|uniref:Cytochrome c domain-containing protein n=1 Tax=Spirosoma telluris TaxID=2183553 RepID=A0A327NHF6_9BACT|nr:c-type cytochrome [Spirosoma telluris]RAI73749.1 hypothetical protein HMF3257_03805 [Spirosoma telluris]
MRQLIFPLFISIVLTGLGTFPSVKNGLAVGVNDIVAGSIADTTANLASEAKQLIASNDCRACHTMQTRAIGPAYKAIAEKYKDDRSASERLANKIIMGGKGVWGESSMSAHPGLSIPEATLIVNYILSLSADKDSAN